MWSNPAASQPLMRDRKRLEELVARDEELVRRTSDIEAYFELAREGEDVLADLERDIKSLATFTEELEARTMLSGGQQQRVAVARALGGSPSIMLADEPTGNLDSRNAENIMELLRELHREGSTICMVTHDPRFARHAERTIHLFDGRVVEETVEVN